MSKNWNPPWWVPLYRFFKKWFSLMRKQLYNDYIQTHFTQYKSSHCGGFQFLLIWVISFHAVVVFGLGKDLLFKYVLWRCVLIINEFKSSNFKNRKKERVSYSCSFSLLRLAKIFYSTTNITDTYKQIRVSKIILIVIKIWESCYIMGFFRHKNDDKILNFS